MRATVIVVLLAATLAAAANAGTPRSPRLEQLRLTSTDNASARAGLIRKTDLIAGWTGGITKADNEDTPPCGWDFSRYTITGDAEADFTAPGARLFTSVEVFAAQAQALGEFGVIANRRTAGCYGKSLVKEAGPATKLVSARSLPRPLAGTRADAFRVVFNSAGKRLTMDVLLFVRGRAIGSMAIVSVGNGLPGADTLARLMDARLRPALG